MTYLLSLSKELNRDPDVDKAFQSIKHSPYRITNLYWSIKSDFLIIVASVEHRPRRKDSLCPIHGANFDDSCLIIFNRVNQRRTQFYWCYMFERVNRCHVLFLGRHMFKSRNSIIRFDLTLVHAKLQVVGISSIDSSCIINNLKKWGKWRKKESDRVPSRHWLSVINLENSTFESIE